MKITILGYGIFGSAIAHQLSLNGNTIIKEDVTGSNIILVSVPSHAVVDVLLSNKSKILNQKIIICSKGFDKSGKLLSIVLKKEFPNNQIYFLYGPTLALGLKDNNISIMILAGGEGKEEIKKHIEGKYLKVELSEDVIGAQVGASLKNTVSIFIGLVEGAGFGQNTQAFIYSIGLKEIQKIGVYFGADPNTFLGPSCAGDLFIRSRSRILGIEIGKGRSYEEVSKEINYPQEGIYSLNNILKINDKNIDLSFFRLMHSVVFENMEVRRAMEILASKI